MFVSGNLVLADYLCWKGMLLLITVRNFIVSLTLNEAVYGPVGGPDGNLVPRDQGHRAKGCERASGGVGWKLKGLLPRYAVPAVFSHVRIEIWP